MVTLRASRNRILDSYTLVSERVFERSVIDDVFSGSELDCFRASTPPIAEIGDSGTFLRRSLQPVAIVAHVHLLFARCARPSINFTSGVKASCQKLFNDVFLTAPTVTEASFRPRYTI